MIKNVRILICPFCAVLFCAYTLIFPLQCSFYISKALSMCASTLIPSLFPFIFLTGFYCRTVGFSGKPGILAKGVKFVFGVSEKLSGVLLLGLFAGFPSGAVGCASLYERGLCEKHECERAIALSDNCSAAFLISAAGGAVLRNPKLGMVMLVSQLLGIVLTAQILRVTRPLKAGTNTAATAPVKPQNTLLCFTDCMKSSCLSMLYICGFVIFFCLVSGIISDKLCALSFAGGSKAYIKAIISGFFEMSSGAFSCASVPFPENSVLCSAVTSFAGLAVILQISAVCIPLGLSVKEYIISRLYMAFLCPLITTALLLLLPYDAMCFSSAAAASQNASGAAGVKLITLFVMAVFAVLCAANSAKNVKNAEKKPQ